MLGLENEPLLNGSERDISDFGCFSAELFERIYGAERSESEFAKNVLLSNCGLFLKGFASHEFTSNLILIDPVSFQSGQKSGGYINGSVCSTQISSRHNPLLRPSAEHYDDLLERMAAQHLSLSELCGDLQLPIPKNAYGDRGDDQVRFHERKTYLMAVANHVGREIQANHSAKIRLTERRKGQLKLCAIYLALSSTLFLIGLLGYWRRPMDLSLFDELSTTLKSLPEETVVTPTGNLTWNPSCLGDAPNFSNMACHNRTLSQCGGMPFNWLQRSLNFSDLLSYQWKGFSLNWDGYVVQILVSFSLSVFPPVFAFATSQLTICSAIGLLLLTGAYLANFFSSTLSVGYPRAAACVAALNANPVFHYPNGDTVPLELLIPGANFSQPPAGWLNPAAYAMAILPSLATMAIWKVRRTFQRSFAPLATRRQDAYQLAAQNLKDSLNHARLPGSELPAPDVSIPVARALATPEVPLTPGIELMEIT